MVVSVVDAKVVVFVRVVGVLAVVVRGSVTVCVVVVGDAASNVDSVVVVALVVLVIVVGVVVAVGVVGVAMAVVSLVCLRYVLLCEVMFDVL